MIQTILVTGANGFVGSRFVRRWGSVFRILAPSHGELDITDAASVERFFAANRPDAVLHLAALSNTMYCQEHPRESLAVNVDGAANVARAAASAGAKLVFFSSDQVYNGNVERGLLHESLPIAPVNIYGCHKHEAERLMAEFCPSAVILRATWMYDSETQGLPLHNNFVVNILRAAQERKPLSFATNEHRGITWVRDAVEFLPVAFELGGGVYNYGAENRLDSYETACCFLEMLGRSVNAAEIILPDIDRFAEKPRNISVSSEKIFRASGGAICFGDTLDGFRRFLGITEFDIN